MKFSRQLVFAFSSLAVLGLTACSNTAFERHQAEDGFTYLNTKAFKQWRLPEGAVPEFNNDYSIPAGNYSGPIGKQVDTRSPVDVLELLTGMQASQDKGVVTLEFINKASADKVWSQIITFFNHNHVPMQDRTPTAFESGKLVWHPKDEDFPLTGQYRFERGNAANERVKITVALVSLTQSGQSKMDNMDLVERYSAIMANTVTYQVEEELRKNEEKKAAENRRHIPVQMGSDLSGFPVVIARSEFPVLWQRLPKVLPSIGFVVTDTSRSDGTLKVKYNRPDDSTWTTLGVKPLTIKSGTYTFMLGDLENRTSINVTNEKGKPINEDDLKSFVPVLEVLFSR